MITMMTVYANEIYNYSSCSLCAEYSAEHGRGETVLFNHQS